MPPISYYLINVNLILIFHIVLEIIINVDGCKLVTIDALHIPDVILRLYPLLQVYGQGDLTPTSG
jgi:hypothetical protein